MDASVLRKAFALIAKGLIEKEELLQKIQERIPIAERCSMVSICFWLPAMKPDVNLFGNMLMKHLFWHITLPSR